MSQQMSFASLAYQKKKKVTHRERFLQEMERCVPWSLLEGIVAPKYPKAGQGRHPFPLPIMVRIYCMQQWFQLSDPGMEDALYDSDSIRRFAGIELGEDAVPDETTILNFRHLLEKHDLTTQMFTEIEGYLEGCGLIVRRGTIMDATIIKAPSSTKNKTQERDPDMSSTKKGNQYYFGMKTHIGVDIKHGLAHTVVCTTASEHDSQQADELLHGDEKEIYGDKAYADDSKRKAHRAQGIANRVNFKAKRGKALTAQQKSYNRSRNRVRAKVEHVFGVMKNLWGYTKVRYRGIEKNACQIFSLLALANIYLVRGLLIAKAQPS
jgi:IS5 family transposase